jgi:UDP-N-acetylmuramate--alanine ligase
MHNRHCFYFSMGVPTSVAYRACYTFSMHIFFSGIGGTGIGPLSLIMHQAGYQVSGSDKQDSSYIHYLQQHGITDIHIGQTHENIAAIHEITPIDWFVYSSAVAIEQPNSPELQFCRDHNIKHTKRDELIAELLEQKNLKLIAIAGTHGKTTTTAMAIWLLQQLGQPLSYSVGAKLSFGDMGTYQPGSQYFVYEADEFDRNFLTFHPYLSLITGVDWDHPDIYPTREAYEQAFRDFIAQSQHTVLWHSDQSRLQLETAGTYTVLDDTTDELNLVQLSGLVNRRNAWQVIRAVEKITETPRAELIEHMNRFPGISRRFEQIAPHLYTDYAHTPPKIRGALQLAHEVAGDNVVVVYEGLHNTRQHFIKQELSDLFAGVKQLYIVPSYLAREDPNLPLLQPDDLKQLMQEDVQSVAVPAELDDRLKSAITEHLAAGDTVLCLSAGGGGSLDEWLRQEFV